MKLGKSQREKDATVVVSIAAMKSGKMLIGLRADDGRWTCPGGHVEPKEEPKEAAHRELLEETGLKASSMECIGFCDVREGLRVWSFLAVVEGSPDASDDPDEEFVEFKWVDPKKFPKTILSNLHNRQDSTLQFLGVQESSLELVWEDDHDLHREVRQLAKSLIKKSVIKKAFAEPDHDASFIDPDPWVEAKYRRGGEAFERYEIAAEKAGLSKASVFEDSEQDHKTDFSDITVPLSLHHLYRSYKNTPHAPRSLLMKYLINKIENKDFYAVAPKDKIDKYEKDWLAFHQRGGASAKNGHIKIEDLRAAEARNPHLSGELETQQQRLHDFIRQTSPWRIKKIDDEEHIPLTRGVRITTKLGVDHSICSYADKISRAEEFGNPLFHWVPLKRVWYSYDHGPMRGTSQNFGNEDEFLVSNHPRKLASKADIDPIFPRDCHDGKMQEDSLKRWNLASSPNLTDEQVKDALAGSAHDEIVVKNPHLNEKQLNLALGSHNSYVLQEVASHPNATPDILRKIMKEPSLRSAQIAALRNPHATPETVSLGIKGGNPNVQKAALRSPHVDSSHLDSLFDMVSHDELGMRVVPELLQVALGTKAAQSRHVEKLRASQDRYDQEAAASSPGASDEQLQNLLLGTDSIVASKAAKNPNLSSESIKKIFSFVEPEKLHRSPTDIHLALAKHPNLTPEAIDAALINPKVASYVRQSLLNSPAVNLKNLYTAMDSAATAAKVVNHPLSDLNLARAGLAHVDPVVRLSAIKNPLLTSEDIEKALSDNSYDIRVNAINHDSATADQISKVLQDSPPSFDDNFEIKRQALKNKNVQPKHIDMALNNVEEPELATLALDHENVSAENIAKAIRHPDVRVRHRAVKHDLVDPNDLTWIIRTDNDNPVVDAALRHPKLNDEGLTAALMHPRDFVYSVQNHPNLKPFHLDKMLENKSWDVRQAAVRHANATDEQIERGLRDPDASVVATAHTVKAGRKLVAQSKKSVEHETNDFEETQKKIHGWRDTPEGLVKSELRKDEAESKDLVSTETKPLQVKHYSLLPNLRALDPAKQGTGQPGPERNRTKRIPRTYYYLRSGKPEAHIAAGGNLYHGELPIGTTLYNFGHDHLGLNKPSWKQTKNGLEYRPADLDAAEKKLAKLGYHGYYNYGVDSALVYFHKLPVQMQPKPGQEPAPSPAPAKSMKKSAHFETLLETWLRKSLPNEDNLDLASQTAIDMLGFQPLEHAAFAAAQFLTGKPELSLADVRRALYDQEDFLGAAIQAYGLTDNEETRASLKAVMTIGFKKSEKDSIPKGKDIVAGTSEAEDAAKAIKSAFEQGHVRVANLDGKHSKGSLIARDTEGDHTYLLKPGSGGQSTAAGASDERASQSRREAAFWQIAESWGLGESIPRCDLLLIDGREYACIQMLPLSWRGLQKRQEKDPAAGIPALRQYLSTGILHKWAVLDGILGQPDRHSDNLMISQDGQLIGLIDHGSAFAGDAFDPAFDRNSFVPYYLRAFAPKGFNRLPVEEKLAKMPVVNEAVDLELKDWFKNIHADRLEMIMLRFGIDPGPTMRRFAKFKLMAAKSTNFSTEINKFWVTT